MLFFFSTLTEMHRQVEMHSHCIKQQLWSRPMSECVEAVIS